MPIGNDKSRITIVVTKESRKILEDLAKSDKRSLSNYCSVILEKHAEDKYNEIHKPLI